MHACRIFIDRCEYDASVLLPRTVGRPADARGADAQEGLKFAVNKIMAEFDIHEDDVIYLKPHKARERER